MTDLTTAERRVLRQLVTGLDVREIGVPNDEAGNERRAGSSDRASAKGASLKRTRIHLGALAVGAVLLLAVASACAGHSTTPTATLTTTAITTAVGISTTTEATPTVLAQSAAPVTTLGDVTRTTEASPELTAMMASVPMYPTYVINETETRQWNGGMWRVFWTDDPAIVVFTFFQDRLRADGWETLQMPMPPRTASDERLNYGGGQDFSKPGFRLTVVAGPTEGERFRTQFRLLLEPEATPSATVPCPLGKDGVPLTRLQGQRGDFRPPSEVRAALSLAKLAALEAYIAFQNGTGTEAAYRAAEARFLELATQPDYNSPVFASPSDATPPEHTMYFSKQGFIEVSPFDDRNLSASEKALDPLANPTWGAFAACVAAEGLEVRADPTAAFTQVDMDRLIQRVNEQGPFQEIGERGFVYHYTEDAEAFLQCAEQRLS